MLASTSIHLLLIGALSVRSSVSLVVGTPLSRRDDNGTSDSCPAKRPDVPGDQSFFDPEDPKSLCKRGGCMSRVVYDQPNIVPGLNPRAGELLWNKAGLLGVSLHSTMNDYVSRGRSRAAENNGQQEANFRDNYMGSKIIEDYDFSKDSPDFLQYWQYTKLPALEVKGYRMIDYSSWLEYTNPGYPPTTSVCGNGDAGVLVSLMSYADCDTNPEYKRAYSSELTWQGWKKVAGDKFNELKVQIRLNVVNDDANKLMALAHVTYPEKVDFIPMERSLTGKLPPWTGHGTWTPDDAAYTILLALPNIKPIVNMIIDVSSDLRPRSF